MKFFYIINCLNIDVKVIIISACLKKENALCFGAIWLNYSAYLLFVALASLVFLFQNLMISLDKGTGDAELTDLDITEGRDSKPETCQSKESVNSQKSKDQSGRRGHIHRDHHNRHYGSHPRERHQGQRYWGERQGGGSHGRDREKRMKKSSPRYGHSQTNRDLHSGTRVQEDKQFRSRAYSDKPSGVSSKGTDEEAGRRQRGENVKDPRNYEKNDYFEMHSEGEKGRNLAEGREDERSHENKMEKSASGSGNRAKQYGSFSPRDRNDQRSSETREARDAPRYRRDRRIGPAPRESKDRSSKLEQKDGFAVEDTKEIGVCDNFKNEEVDCKEGNSEGIDERLSEGNGKKAGEANCDHDAGKSSFNEKSGEYGRSQNPQRSRNRNDRGWKDRHNYRSKITNFEMDKTDRDWQDAKSENFEEEISREFPSSHNANRENQENSKPDRVCKPRFGSGNRHRGHSGFRGRARQADVRQPHGECNDGDDFKNSGGRPVGSSGYSRRGGRGRGHRHNDTKNNSSSITDAHQAASKPCQPLD